MINVAAVMEIEVKRPYYNEYERGLKSTDFSRLCDGWLRIILDRRRQRLAAFAASTKIPPDTKISLQTYRDILEPLL